jgi:hypothetical protein
MPSGAGEKRGFRKRPDRTCHNLTFEERPSVSKLTRVPVTRSTLPLLVGLRVDALYDKSHVPIPGQKVILTISGHTFQTYSNKKGAYSFFGLSPVIETTGSLSVGNSKQTISIGPARLARDITIRIDNSALFTRITGAKVVRTLKMNLGI